MELSQLQKFKPCALGTKPLQRWPGISNVLANTKNQFFSIGSLAKGSLVVVWLMIASPGAYTFSSGSALASDREGISARQRRGRWGQFEARARRVSLLSTKPVFLWSKHTCNKKLMKFRAGSSDSAKLMIRFKSLSGRNGEDIMTGKEGFKTRVSFKGWWDIFCPGVKIGEMEERKWVAMLKQWEDFRPKW